MNMTHPDILHAEMYGMPEAEIIGECKVCEEKIYDYDEYRVCSICDKTVHKNCMTDDICEICEEEDE